MSWTSNARSQDFIDDRQGSLTITAVTYTHSGVYTCTARAGGYIDTNTIEVRVEAPRPGPRNPPRILEIRPSYYELNSGPVDSQKVFECVVEGEPVPKVTWRREVDNQRYPLDGEFVIQGNRLILPSVIRKSHEGNYVCEAQNYVGEASMAVVVYVREGKSYSQVNEI